MDTKELVALSGPLIYFVGSIVLFSIILKGVKPKTQQVAPSWLSTVYGLLALGSCIHCFILIFQSLKWSYDNFYASQDYTVVGDSTQRIAFWLQHTSVFKEIWVHGSKGVLNWWWLQNLCIFTAGAWTILLATEGRRRNVPHLWAYMIISEFVAVSTALSLFFLALTYRTPPPKPIPSKKSDDINAVLPPTESDGESGVQVIIPVLLALFTISIWPEANSSNFDLLLAALHLLLFIPVLPSPLWTTSPRILNLPVLRVYFAVTAVSLVIRLQTTLTAASSLLPEAGIGNFATAVTAALHSHPAVSVFGWDTIWTTAIYLVWSIFKDGTSKPQSQQLLPMLSASAALGVGFAAPMQLGHVIDEVFADASPPKRPSPKQS